MVAGMEGTNSASPFSRDVTGSSFSLTLCGRRLSTILPLGCNRRSRAMSSWLTDMILPAWVSTCAPLVTALAEETELRANSCSSRSMYSLKLCCSIARVLLRVNSAPYRYALAVRSEEHTSKERSVRSEEHTSELQSLRHL